MASQADKVFGEIGSDITPEEEAHMRLSGNRLGNGCGRVIASQNETAATLEMLDHVVLVLPERIKTLTYEDVVADRARMASGQKSTLFAGGNQPQAVQPSDSSGGGVTVGGDPVAAVKHAVDTHPQLAPLLLDWLNAAVAARQGGASEEAMREQTDESIRVVAGQERAYQLVPGPNGTDKMLRGIVDADKAKTQAITERDAMQVERDNLQQQLNTRTQPLPADQVAKSAVASDVTALIGIVRGAGRSVRPDAVKPSINAIADKVGVTDKLA